MASLGEIIQLAQFQMQNKQMNNPLAQLGNLAEQVFPVAQEMQERQRRKQAQTKMQDVINTNTGKPGFSYEIDQDGNMKAKFDSSAKSKAWKFNNKIIKYDPSTDIAEVIFNDSAEGEEDLEDLDNDPEYSTKKKFNPEDVASWSDVPFVNRIMAALTPSATTEEKKLGGLRIGGTLNPPKPKSEASLPNTVKTTKEAVNHLMSNYNMTQEEAIAWVRSKLSDAE